MGADPGSGVVLPSLKKIAAAYGIPYVILRNNRTAERKMPDILSSKGPVLVEVLTDPEEVLGPKAASRSLPDGKIVSLPLEDMFPFLSREELAEFLHIARHDR